MRKKLLFIITKSEMGGAQRYVFDLALNLPEDKFTVLVAAGGTGILKEKLEREKIRVMPVSRLKRDTTRANAL